MKDYIYCFIIGVLIAIICAVFISFFARTTKIGTPSIIISSPVEEMYHKQLVNTIDSILDARFGCDCNEDYIDIDSIIVK